MQDAAGDMLQTAVRHHWSRTPSDKAKRYVDAFFDTTRIGTKIIGSVGIPAHAPKCSSGDLAESPS